MKTLNIFCRKYFDTNGYQSKVKKHFLRCFEQEVCNMSNFRPDKKLKNIDYSMKINPSMWIAADFGCMNVPVKSSNHNFMETLFVNKPIARGYIVVKNLDYDN